MIVSDNRVGLNVSCDGAGGQCRVVLYRQRPDDLNGSARGRVHTIRFDRGGRQVLLAGGGSGTTERHGVGRVDRQRTQRRRGADQPERYAARARRQVQCKGAVDGLERHVPSARIGRNLDVAGESDRRVEADVVVGGGYVGGRVNRAGRGDGNGSVGIDICIGRQCQVAGERFEDDRTVAAGIDARQKLERGAGPDGRDTVGRNARHPVDAADLEVVGVAEVDQPGGRRQHVDVIGRVGQCVGAAGAL